MSVLQKIKLTAILILLPMMTQHMLSPVRVLASKKQSIAVTSNLYGGTITWGCVGVPDRLNPVLTYSTISANLNNLIYDPLIRINNQGEVFGAIAEKWSISDDGLVYTFYIRENVYFHDGIQLTAKDVLFTFNTALKYKKQSVEFFPYVLLDHFAIEGDFTFKVYLKKPYPKLLKQMILEIMPEHVWKNADFLYSDFNKKPVGTGIFKIRSWDDHSQEIVLDANVNHFNGRPYLDHLVIKPYQSDNELWAALMRHEVDLMMYLSKENFTVVKNDNAFRAYAVDGGVYLGILFNRYDKYFKHLEVRQAFTMALDHQAMMDELNIYGTEAQGPFHPRSEGFNKDVKAIGFNPEKSRLIFSQYGLTDKYVLTMLVDQRNLFFCNLAKIIQRSLADVGVRVDVIFYQDEKTLTPEMLKKIKPHLWLRYFLGLSDGQLDSVQIEDWFPSKGGPFEYWSYPHKSIDKLFDLLTVEEDQDSKLKIMKEIHAQIYALQPMSFLFFPSSLFAIHSRIKGAEACFTPHMPLYLIKDWSLR